MSRSNQWVNVALVLIILIHLVFWAVGYFTNKFLLLTTVLNVAAGLSIIIYWAVRQTQIKQHTIELREIVVLGAEALLIGCALYWLITNHLINIIRVVQYTFFAIHLCLSVLALIFALTFRMSKMI